MDLASLMNLTNQVQSGTNTARLLLGNDAGVAATSLTKTLTGFEENAQGTMFEAILNSAISNLNTTDDYLNAHEAEEIKFAIGETDNTHDLMIAATKASTALSYTVALRDKFLQAYREIMQLQV
ncbi:MAG: flagellar hook-basal body complex protein FliE [Lachnospiraceae bacterium]|jgi:flagellar hook-basal body complex protein FliE|nr:flagellar hook-basal body complex protein FliE [Lachnospiraceae bacterium]